MGQRSILIGILGAAFMASGACVGSDPEVDSESRGTDGGPPADAQSSDATDGAAPPDVIDAGTDALADCPSGATRFGGHCYWATDALPFIQAKAACELVPGAHLATIANEEEGLAVASVAGAGNDLWIGLQATTGNGGRSFQWVTGEALTTQLWKESEPDQSGDCVVIVDSTSSWADRPCNEINPGACELP